MKRVILAALVGVLVSGPASADEFPPGIDWLMKKKKPVSFWDLGNLKYKRIHEQNKIRLSRVLGGKKS